MFFLESNGVLRDTGVSGHYVEGRKLEEQSPPWVGQCPHERGLRVLICPSHRVRMQLGGVT